MVGNASASEVHVDAPMLEWHDLTVAYGRRPVLWNVDFEIPKPCLFGIIGPNGAGKSTLLKASLDLVQKAGGSVRFWGQPLAQVRSRIAYVPQRETVDWDFPVTVMDVVRMGATSKLGWFQRGGKRERELALGSLDRVGLADFSNRQIGKLSGGQQQRVFLARALAREADIYLLDEPMAGVDAGSQEQIFNILVNLRDQGKLIVAVHHDIRTAVEWFDAVALIDMRLVAAGPTAEILTPENLTMTYSGRLSVLDEIGEAVERGGRTS